MQDGVGGTDTLLDAAAALKEPNYPRAKAIYRTLIPLAQEAGQWDYAAKAATTLGAIINQEGQIELAYQVYIRPAYDSARIHLSEDYVTQWQLTVTTYDYYELTGQYHQAWQVLQELMAIRSGFMAQVKRMHAENPERYREGWLASMVANYRISLYQGMGNLLLKLDQLEASQLYMDSLLRESGNFNSGNLSWETEQQRMYGGIAYSGLALIATQQGEHARSIELHRKAYDLVKGASIPVRHTTLRDMAASFLAMGERDSALATLRRAVQEVPDHEALAVIYPLMAQVFYEQGKWDSTLRYAHAVQAVQAGQAPFSGSVDAAYDLQDLRLDFRLLTALMYESRASRQLGLGGKTDCAVEIQREDLSISALERAHATHQLLLSAVDSLRRSNYFSPDDGGFVLADTIASVMDEAIEVASLLGDLQPKQREAYQEKALQFSEVGKYNVLYYQWRKAQLSQYTSVPTDTLARIQLVQSQLLYHQNLLRTQEGTAADSLARLIDGLRQQRKALVTYLQTNHPAYHRLAYQPLDISVAHIQQQLTGPNTAVLEYHYGATQLVSFLITQDTFQVQRTCLDGSLEKAIGTFYRCFTHPRPDTLSPKDILAEYAVPAHTLYQELVAPLRPSLAAQEGPLHLRIVADGPLRPLNFAAFLTELPDRSTQLETYAQWPYLSQDDQLVLSYENSLTFALGREARTRSTETEGSYLGFAAWYRDLSLEEARQSVERLALVDWSEQARALVGTAAKPLSPASFLELNEQFEILQLAMHGEADSLNSLGSRLLFSDTDTLFAKDLYPKRLASELVILDACETGLGKVLRGEGVMSLSRAFSFAGVPSALVSQYRINVGASQVLIEDFLAQLREGVPKDLAWRQAQRNFPQRWNQTPLPHYWAGLMPVGDMRPLPSTQGGFPWGILLTVLGSLMIAGLVLRRFF